MSDTLDFQQAREQDGFRKSFSTVDHVYAINHVIEKSAEYNKPLYVAFIQYEKALGSVATTVVVEAFRNHGIEETCVALFEDIYEVCEGTIPFMKRLSSLLERV